MSAASTKNPTPIQYEVLSICSENADGYSPQRYRVSNNYCKIFYGLTISNLQDHLWQKRSESYERQAHVYLAAAMDVHP